MIQRRLLLVMAILFAGFLAWEFIPIQVTIWDGRFNLTVHIECVEGQPQKVHCTPCGSRELAETLVAHLTLTEQTSGAVMAAPFDSQPLTVLVPMSGHESPLGRELERWQFPYMAVIVMMPDGRRFGKVVEIPDGRVSRDIVVKLP